MNESKIDKHFQKIGSRLVTVPLWQSRPPQRPGNFRLDVKTDPHKKEYFELSWSPPVTVIVRDVKPAEKHLLLDVIGRESRLFLCGHDERHYFAAGVERNARDVFDAMLKLVPEPVREAVSKLPRKEWTTRRNEIFKRQGEWFFIPAPKLFVKDELTLAKEPLRRGRSKPHIVECLHSTGGTQVRICGHYPNGLTFAEFDQSLTMKMPGYTGRQDAMPTQFEHGELCLKHPFGRVMTRDAVVYARGAVTHPDHATLHLKEWHRVLMSSEVMSEQMAFLD